MAFQQQAVRSSLSYPLPSFEPKYRHQYMNSQSYGPNHTSNEASSSQGYDQLAAQQPSQAPHVSTFHQHSSYAPRQALQPPSFSSYPEALGFHSEPSRTMPAAAFYSYRPNEVKHRKRTTRVQTKILEEHFRLTDKPDAAARNELSRKLGMTPREVQVWFQNRRAKEKKLRAAAVAAIAKDNEESLSSQDEKAGPSSASQVSPSATAPAESPSTQYSTHTLRFAADTMPLGDGAVESGAQQSAIFVPASMQASTSAAPSVAYATFSQMTQASTSSSEGLRSHYSASNIVSPTDPLAHRPSLPHIRTSPNTEQHHQRSSSSPSFPPPTDYPFAATPFTAVPSNRFPSAAHTYVFPARTMPPSVTGPLPSPNYSFGAPVNPLPAADVQREEEAPRISYSRFGSSASVAGSDTSSSFGALSFVPLNEVSIATAYKDDGYALAYPTEARRPSLPQVVDVVNGIPVGVVPGEMTQPLYQSPGQGISPFSSGVFSSGSPGSVNVQAGQNTSPLVFTSPEYAAYDDRAEQQGFLQGYGASKADSGMNIAFQKAMYYGAVDNSSSLGPYSDSLFTDTTQFYNGIPGSVVYDASLLGSQRQFDDQISVHDNGLALQNSLGYEYSSRLYNTQYSA